MSYLTISVIVLSYLIFAAFCISRRKWVHLLIHPFVPACFFTFLFFRNETTVPGMERITDDYIAGGFLLVFTSYWVAHWLCGKSGLNNLLTRLSQVEKYVLGDKLPTPIVWAFLGLACCVPIIYLFFMASSGENSWDFLFNKYRRNATVIQFDLWSYQRYMMLACSWFLSCQSFFMAVFFAESCCKDSIIKGTILYCLCIISVLLTTSVGLVTGMRSDIALLPALTTLVLVSYFYQRRSFAWPCLSVYGCHLILCVLLVLLVPLMRGRGEQALARFWASPNKIQYFYRGALAFLHSTNPNTKEKVKMLQQRVYAEKGVDVNETPLPTLTEKKQVQSDDQAVKIPVSPDINTLISPQNQIITDAHSRPDSIIEDQQQVLLAEKAFLHAYNGRTVMDEAGWAFAYYGTHADYLGLTYSFKVIAQTFLPREIIGEKNVRLGKRLWSDRQQTPIAETRGSALVGPVVEGYMCGGILGICLLSVFWGGFAGAISSVYSHYFDAKCRDFHATVMSAILYYWSYKLVYTGLAQWFFCITLVTFVVLSLTITVVHKWFVRRNTNL